MQIRRRRGGRGPSAKHLNRFLRDGFCIEDVDTIMRRSSEEVVCWMMGTGFEQYAFACYALHIDGNMLIRDVNRESIVEDLGGTCWVVVLKVRCTRQIEKLRAMETTESLQERDQVMQALEAKSGDGDGDEEESGSFSNKIAELEEERDGLRQGHEQLAQQM